MGARRHANDACRIARDFREVWPARPRRRRLPDGEEVVVSSEQRQPAVSGLQLRRGRAGHVQRSHAAGEQAALDPGRDAAGRVRHQVEPRVHLHSRRVQGRIRDLHAGFGAGARRGHGREEYFWVRLRSRSHRAARRRRIHLRRGDRVAQLARGQARGAASEAAFSGHRRPLRHADRRQQRRDAGVSRARPAKGLGMVCRSRHRAQQRLQDRLGFGPRAEAGQLRDSRSERRSARSSRSPAAFVPGARSRPFSLAAVPQRAFSTSTSTGRTITRACPRPDPCSDRARSSSSTTRPTS